MKVHSFIREIYPLAVRLKIEASKKTDDLKVILLVKFCFTFKIFKNQLKLQELSLPTILDWLFIGMLD